MPHLHLPAQHTDEDLAMAGALASMLRSADLYVAWSTDGGPALPVVPATVRAVDETPVVLRGRRRNGRLARWLDRLARA